MSDEYTTAECANCGCTVRGLADEFPDEGDVLCMQCGWLEIVGELLVETTKD